MSCRLSPEECLYNRAVRVITSGLDAELCRMFELGLNVHMTEPGMYGPQQTFLHMAAARGLHQTVRILRLHGADVDAQDGMGSTAVLLASTSPYPLITVSTLLSKIRGRDGNWLPTPNVNIANTLGYTALFMAVRDGQIELVRLLVRFGASTTTQTYAGETPRGIAGRPEVREALEKK